MDTNSNLLDRRQVLRIAAAGAASSVPASATLAQSLRRGSIKAIAFDAFVIFDPGSVAVVAEELFPGKGAALVSQWRIRQFEYSWLRTLSGRYTNFWNITEHALVYSAMAAKLDLTASKREQLMRAFLELKAYPDVPPGLLALREAGIRLGFLSNMTERMLDAAIESAGLNGMFEQVLSTDRVQAYKPDPRAYQMAIDAFALPREEIVFAASGGWDAAGAKSFGYPTFWANRLKLPTEVLEAPPDAIGENSRRSGAVCRPSLAAGTWRLLVVLSAGLRARAWTRSQPAPASSSGRAMRTMTVKTPCSPTSSNTITSWPTRVSALCLMLCSGVDDRLRIALAAQHHHEVRDQ